MPDEQRETTGTAAWVVRPDPDLADLIPSFMSNRQNDMKDIDGALAKDDFEFIRRIAHTWKGISRPYGFDHLETLSRDLEAAGVAENRLEARAIVDQIRSYLENVRIVLDS